MKGDNTDPPALRITNQFRSSTGFAYDLKANGERLTLSILSRQATQEPGQWLVAARLGSAPDTPAIEASGPTRLDALREVGRRWQEQAIELRLPSFDWDAVAKALADVRAI